MASGGGNTMKMPQFMSSSEGGETEGFPLTSRGIDNAPSLYSYSSQNLATPFHSEASLGALISESQEGPGFSHACICIRRRSMS